MKNGIFGGGRIPGPIRFTLKNAPLIHVSPSQQSPKPLKTDDPSQKAPEEDGEINLYETSPYQWNLLVERSGKIENRLGMRGGRSEKSPVLFVNGIKGSGKKHRQQALLTSAFSGGPVEGVFNKSDGMVKDLIQCINDKRTSAEYMAVKGTLGGWIDSLADFVGLGGDESTAQKWIENSISDNPATLNLFRKLLEPGYENATIVAHSQGNIITSNALNAVAALRGASAIERMRVIAVGSPVVFWSEFKNVHKFGFKNDGVVWASFSIGEDKAYSGNSLFTGWKSVEDSNTEEPTSLKESYSPFESLTHTYFLYVARYWDDLVSLFP